jgi:hypothetical protein
MYVLICPSFATEFDELIVCHSCYMHYRFLPPEDRPNDVLWRILTVLAVVLFVLLVLRPSCESSGHGYVVCVVTQLCNVRTFRWGSTWKGKSNGWQNFPRIHSEVAMVGQNLDVCWNFCTEINTNLSSYRPIIPKWFIFYYVCKRDGTILSSMGLASKWDMKININEHNE